MKLNKKLKRNLIISPIIAIGSFSLFYGIAKLLGLFDASPLLLIILGALIIFISIKFGWKK